ncbi:MAG TPA: hypothetical protein VGM87_24445 [Roseomonas sp.]|jgi:hypothetical protein
MRTFEFRGRGGLVALTLQPDGRNLPRRGAPWRYERPVELEEGTPVLEYSMPHALADIKTKGLHLVRERVTLESHPG